MDQSKIIIRFSRDKNIEASRANAILALDNFLNIVGQPVIVRYYRDEAKTKIDMMLAVGIQNGKGRETYSIIYAGSPDAIIFGVSKVPGLYPDVSLLAHGELYIVKDTDGDYCYCYAINDRRHIEKITGGPYRYLNITNLSSWTFDGGELRKDNSYEKGTENDLVTGTDNESKVWDAKTLSEFVNSSLINATKFKGGFDAGTGIIDGTQDTLTSIEEKIGDVYTAITAGTFAGKVLEIGDSIIFKRNVAAGTEVVEDDIILVQSTVNVINKNATLEWQISKTIATIEGTDITVSLPANPNTDTKVTSVDNHYTPVINPASEVDATLVGGAGSYAKDTEYTVLTGVSAQGDAKGHITGMTYTAQKIKDTNTTYTFSDGTEGVGKFKVKSSDSDTTQEVTVSGMDSKQNKVPKLGSSTKPIYTSSEGTFAEGSTYAGGTKVTLNGSDKGAKNASIYAPESAGTKGQFLSANASGTPVWVANPNTDTKVTSVDNHYEPVADGSKEITATITGSAGSYSKDTEYTVLTGVKAQRDAKGHVTGLTYTAQKIKDTNTEYTKGSYNEIVSGTGTTGKLWDAKSIHDYVGAGASQLIISNPFISIPTDEHGVVLNDFSQEITLGLYVNDHTITTSDVQITENPPRYVTWEESLTAFPVSEITVSAPTVNTPGTASASNNNLNLININGLYVVPTTIRVQVSQGTTLIDKGVDILAYGYDENGRLYNGSGVLFIQQHQFWIERPQFTSMVFKRATTKPSTPNGGTYDNPIPTGWQDGIPSGTGGIVWATTCVFYGDGTKSGWAEPQAQIDLDTLDIEFSPNETQPVNPDDDPALRPAQGWYNPSSLPVGKEIIWRAERKKKNGAYVGDWVVTRILGEKGEDGRSITKASADTYRYAVSSSGTVVPSSGWQNSRPTVPQGQYLWTETTIHWSDNSTTTLYGVERNPNDGVEGMSVVITSQSIDYCRRTAEQGQADPSTLTYSTYPSTLNQGDWLYTRTTVNYEDGDGHAYSTVSYSVSRIGENGANGSGISGITEYYKASSSSTNPPPRTGGSDWETNPMPSDWNMSKRYLWNYEKITKVDSAGNITYERTTPGVIAIYTEDGKGIDSIINYYVATSHSSGVTTDNPDDGEWTTTIQTTTEQKPYLWNYEIIYYIKEGQSAGSTTTDPHIIHNFATSPYFADIDNEIQSVACEVDGKPTSAKSMVTNVSMWKGSNKLTLTNLTAALVTGENIGINREQSGGVYTGKITFTVSSSNAISEVNTISIRAYYGEIYRDLLFTINGVRGGKDAELYELVPSINDIAKRKDGSYLPSGNSNITCSVVKTKGNTVSTITPGTGTGVILKYSLNGGTETAYTGGIRVDTVTSNLIFILYKEGTNTVLDRETIPLVIDGIDGTSPYFADIDNEMQSVACDKNGYPVAAKTMNAIVTMWEGTNPLTITTLTVTKLSGSGVTATATPSSGVIVFTVSPSTAISDVNTFQISVSANGVSKTLYFTVNGVRPGPDGKPAISYELVPNTTEVVKRKDGSYSPSGNITCSITKNQGGDQSTPATNEYVLKKSLNGGKEVIINTSDETAPSSIVSNLVYSLYDSTGTKLIDRETIPLIYDGNDSAQLVFSSPLISVPTDNEGVVLEDFTQEITARLMMSGKSLRFSNITVSESDPKYISWENKLTSLIVHVHVSKGSLLSEKNIEVTVAGYDTAGNEYQGYGTLRIQCQYWVEKAQFQSIVFKRSNSEPSTPTGGIYTNPIPEGWEDGIPGGVGIVWASVCTFYGDGTTSGWSKPQAQIDTDELDIEFSPSETQPSDPTGDPFINRESQGWYDPMSPNFPTAGTMIWRAERKVKNGEWATSESGEVSEWVVTRIYGEQGDTGSNGYNTATIMLYKRSSTPITSVGITGDCTYNFETKALSGNLNNWSRTIPTVSTDEIYVTAATANSREITDKIGSNEWATPAKMAANGAHGINTATVFLYARNATAPTIPYGSHTYTFNTGVLSGDLGVWSQIIPVNNGQPCWVIQATALSDKATDTIEQSEWSSPNKLVENGKDGENGKDAINVSLSPFAVLFSQDVSSDDDTAAHAIAQITPETISSQVVLTKGETPITTSVVVSVSSTSHFNTSGVTIKGTTITLDKDGIQIYETDGRYYPYDNGYVDLNVAYNGKNYPLRLQFYVNLMGKFKTTIEGDVETSIASKHTYYLNADGTALERDVEQQGTYIRSAEENINRLDEQVNNPTTGLEHKYSIISQNVNNISLKVGQYYNLFYNAFFGELLAERSPYNYYTRISLVNEGTYGSKVIRMGGAYFSETITSSPMGSDTKGYGVYLDKGTYTFQMYAKVSNTYSSSAFAGVELLWDDNADFSTWNSSKIIYRMPVTGTSYSRYTYTFTLSSARYVGFRLTIDGISTGSTEFFLYIDAVMLEIGSTASSMISSYGGNQSGAEVGKVQRNLLATGIDIEKGKITMTADKFECQNNSGVKTAWLDNLGNFTTTGVYNNLITVINYSKNKGKELIITEYTNETSGAVTFDLPSGGTWSYYDGWIYRVNNVNYKVEWWIDVLRCGDFVNILSLPKYGGSAQIAQYNLPYYATNDIQKRGYTRFSSGEIHQMSADELRMLVGRKMTFKIGGTGFSIPSANRYYTHIGDFFNLEPYTGSSTGNALNGLGYLANGKNFYITPTSSNKTYCPCYQLVAHVEFKNTTWSSSKTSVDYSGYGYVWSYSQANMDPVDRANDGLDSWT